MTLPNPFPILNGPDATTTVLLAGAQLNHMNTAPVTVVPGVHGHLIIPTRLTDVFVHGTTSYAGDFTATWQWLLGSTNYGAPFDLMVNGATLADDLETQGDDVWFPTIISSLINLIGQPLLLSNAANFTGSLGIATSNLNTGGTGYAPGDTFNVTGGGGTGATGVVDTVLEPFPIIEVDISANVVVVAGDQTGHYTPLDSVVIAGSPANDGTYTVTSATLNIDGTTSILLVQPLVNNVPGGTISSVDDGAVLTYHLTSSGTGYAVTIGAATTHTSGSGDDAFTIDIDTVGDGDGILALLLDYRVVPVEP